jgi:hypothetical protein
VTNEYASPLIRAELIGSDTCIALGIRATGDSPILKLCRLLIKAGHDPDSPLHVYRGATLALTVSSIGEGAALRATTTVAGACVSSQLGPRTRIPAKLANMEWFSRLLSGLARLSAFVREVHRGTMPPARGDSRMIEQTS